MTILRESIHTRSLCVLPCCWGTIWTIVRKLERRFGNFMNCAAKAYTAAASRKIILNKLRVNGNVNAQSASDAAQRLLIGAVPAAFGLLDSARRYPGQMGKVLLLQGSKMPEQPQLISDVFRVSVHVMHCRPLTGGS